MNNNPYEEIGAFNIDSDEPYVNLSLGFLHKKTQPFESFDDKTQASVHMILDYLRVVFANDDEKMYEYLVNWLA